MRDADLDSLLAEDIPYLIPAGASPPAPASSTPLTGPIGAASVPPLPAICSAARRRPGTSSARPSESPWTAAILRLATSAIAVIVFAIALIAAFMVAG